MCGEEGLDPFRVLGLMLPKISDIAEVFPQFRQIIPPPYGDKNAPSTSKLQGIVVVAAVFSAAGCLDNTISCLMEQARKFLFQLDGLDTAAHGGHHLLSTKNNASQFETHFRMDGGFRGLPLTGGILLSKFHAGADSGAERRRLPGRAQFFMVPGP